MFDHIENLLSKQPFHMEKYNIDHEKRYVAKRILHIPAVVFLIDREAWVSIFYSSYKQLNSNLVIYSKGRHWVQWIIKHINRKMHENKQSDICNAVLQFSQELL